MPQAGEEDEEEEQLSQLAHHLSQISDGPLGQDGLQVNKPLVVMLTFSQLMLLLTNFSFK